MAHLPPDAAIFSPSVARLAASTAKDWSHVDAWLASKYGHTRARDPPSFERNPDTLRALLALAHLNEAADETRALLARAETDALREVRAAEEEDEETKKTNHQDDHYDDDDDDNDDDDETNIPPSLPSFKETFLAALESHLPRDGHAALDAMALAALHLNHPADPAPPHLAQSMLRLQTRHADLAQAASRVDVLRRHVAAESARLDALLLHDLGGDQYRPPADLARQNLDTQRAVKAMAKKVPEMRDKLVAPLARAAGGPPAPTIQQVRREEEVYLRLLDAKRALDQQLREFEGLPPDTALARQQLEGLRRELRDITDRRDAVFEGLVERETPRKGR